MEVTIGYPTFLTSYQKKILLSPKRFTITEASTKAGKTLSHMIWLFIEAHKPEVKRGFNFWWVAPVYQQAEIAFKRYKSKLIDKGVYKFYEKPRLEIICPNGAVIKFLSADNPDNLYGEDVHAAVFDEAPRAKYDSWVALRTTLTATNAPAKLIGNFKGISNWMHQLKEESKDKNSNYEYFKITAYQAVEEGVLKLEEIEQAKKDLTPSQFKMLYLAEASEDEDSLIDYDAINELFTNPPLPTKGQKYITADIALDGSDKFVLYLWKDYDLFDMVLLPKTDGKEIESKIKELAFNHRIPNRNITYDADGVGGFLKGYLKGAIPFHNGSTAISIKGEKQDYANLKSQCSFLCARRINRNEYSISAKFDMKDKLDLIAEMEQVKNDTFGTDGKLRIQPKKKTKEILGRSPDLWDAFMMREIFEIIPRSNKIKRHK